MPCESKGINCSQHLLVVLFLRALGSSRMICKLGPYRRISAYQDATRSCLKCIYLSKRFSIGQALMGVMSAYPESELRRSPVR
jgi:hypothetical protein